MVFEWICTLYYYILYYTIILYYYTWCIDCFICTLITLAGDCLTIKKVVNAFADERFPVGNKRKDCVSVLGTRLNTPFTHARQSNFGGSATSGSEKKVLAKSISNKKIVNLNFYHSLECHLTYPKYAAGKSHVSLVNIVYNNIYAHA